MLTQIADSNRKLAERKINRDKRRALAPPSWDDDDYGDGYGVGIYDGDEFVIQVDHSWCARIYRGASADTLVEWDKSLDLAPEHFYAVRLRWHNDGRLHVDRFLGAADLGVNADAVDAVLRTEVP